jgi:hypothetical protein
MWILLLFFSTFLSAQDETATEKFCFSSTDIMAVRKKLTMIEVSSDSISVDGKCLVAVMKTHRRELIQKYLLSNFQDMSIAFSSENLRKESCKLRIEKEKVKQGDDLDINLNRDKLQVTLDENRGHATEEIQIQTIRDFQLSINQDEIFGKCTPLSPDRYIIALEIKKNPKPLVDQNLPPGSVIIMDRPAPDQETMLLKTEIRLSRGERINIGNIVKNLKTDNAAANSSPSGTAKAQDQKQSEMVFLSLQ